MKNNITKYDSVEEIFGRVCEKYNIDNRNFAEADFYRICEAEHITLLNDSLGQNFFAKNQLRTIRGFYMSDPVRNFRLLYLRSFFLKKFDLTTAFHELGHHFLKHSGLKITNSTANLQKEREADYFAELATGPKLVTRI